MSINKLGTHTLETPRLILRRFRLDDAQAMYDNYCSDGEVTKYLTWSPHANIEVTRMFLASNIQAYENPSTFRWALELKAIGEVIGCIDLVGLHEHDESGVLGWVLSRKYWGLGLMPEALLAVEKFMFEYVGLHRLEATHHADNYQSGRVMQKGHMTCEGRRREAFLDHTGRHVDLVVYSILADEYRNQKKF